jgi:hypothetical protein
MPDSGYGTASKAGTMAHQPPQPPLDQETEFTDNASVITNNLSLDLPRDTRDAYVDAFVYRILGATSQLSADEILRTQLLKILLDLLCSFALRVAFSEQTTDERALGVFTRQYREQVSSLCHFVHARKMPLTLNAPSRITESVQKTLQSRQHGSGALDDDSIVSERRNSTDNNTEMNFHEEVGLWLVGEPTDGDGMNEWDEMPRGEDDAEDNEGGDLKHNPKKFLSEADMERISFAVNTSSFSWLLKVVQSRSQLSYSTADALDSIRKPLSFCLNQYRGNRALRSQKVVIRMALDPRVFIEQQGYEGSHYLLTALTITGSSTKARLLSCEEYLKQTWPLTGETVLEALIEVARADHPGTPVTRSLFDGLQLTLHLDTEGVRAGCIGLFDSIVEVAEVLAWIWLRFARGVLNSQEDHAQRRGPAGGRESRPVEFAGPILTDIYRGGNPNRGCAWWLLAAWLPQQSGHCKGISHFRTPG